MTALQRFLDQIALLGGGSIANFFAALAILIVGWLVAWIISAIVRAALQRTALDERLGHWIRGEEEREKKLEVGDWIAKGIFYVIMLFVLVAFFQTLGLTIITQPLNNLLIEIFRYLPRVAGAGILLLIAWIVASIVKFLLLRSLKLVKFDERIGQNVEETQQIALSQTLADVVYWLIFLLFLPAVLSALALEGLLQPVQNMVNQVLGYLPNLFAAALIMAIGWFAARIIQRIVTNLLIAVGVDRLSQRTGVDRVLGEQRLSKVLGMVLYVLVMIPVLIAALNALNLEAITAPAAAMLNAILLALPAIFAAMLVLAFSYIVGRVVARLVANVLAGIGFNSILARLGLGVGPGVGAKTPSEIVGYLVLVAIMLFASIEALNLLGFTEVAALVLQFTELAGRILLGLIIFALGLFLADVAAYAIRSHSNSPNARLLAIAGRVSILVLAGAMALRQMGLANEIVTLGFGLLLGSVAVAAALAFGLGGRAVAGRELEDWVESVKSRESSRRM